MKRKLNRAKKEQQVYLHKVHVLCWIGHGNYVSCVLNDQDIMSAALSLVPSKECYPGERVDIKYLEQITSWYKDKLRLNQDKHEDKFKPKAPPLKELLLEQIKQKIVKTRKYLVFIFVAMLRALGLQCRVMFNFVTLPLKPLSSDLCSLSTKTHHEASKKTNNGKVKKNTSSMEKAKLNKEKLSQLDGNADGEFDNINQVDGSDCNSPVKSKRSKRTNSKNTSRQNEEVLPSKILKKSSKIVKSNVESVDKTGITYSMNKRKCTKHVPSVSDDKSIVKESKPAKTLSLRPRKKDNTCINKSRENCLTNPNVPHASANLRKTKTKITAANIAIETSKVSTVDCSTQNKNKVAPPEIIITQSKESSEYFKDEQNCKVKKVRLSRKRSHTTETNHEAQPEVTKPRNKSAPGEIAQKSKYFNEDRGETSLGTSKKLKIKDQPKQSPEDRGSSKSKLEIDVTDDLINIINTRIKEEKSKSPKRVVKGESTIIQFKKNLISLVKMY